MDDAQLMEAFTANKSRELFSTIYQRNHKELFRFTTWLSGDTELARDITQNVFLKVFTKPQLFDSSKPLKVWLFSIAKNQWKNEVRHRSVRQNHAESIALNVPSEVDNLDQTKNKKALQIALNTLSFEHKEVVLLKYSNNLTIEEISAYLDCSEGTVKSRLFYALKKLRKELVPTS